MARLARVVSQSPDEANRLHSRQDTEIVGNTDFSPTSFSDKENHNHSLRGGKRKSDSQAMPPPSQRTPGSASSNKRRRLVEVSSNLVENGSQSVVRSQTRRSQRTNTASNFYDPDQDENERRRVKKELRDLTRDLHDNRQEYLQAGNKGIVDTIKKANDIFVHVKQTSDATVDSRLLVNAADLSYKKTASLILGDASAGIDVDEFVSKCISFMRHGPDESNASPINSTQRRSQRARNEDEGEEDEGDALNWDWLGRRACLPYNARPSVSGFLLGPLSVQKRVRQQTQRRARERIDPSQAVRPQELQEEDLDKQETSNLTAMCTKINRLLSEIQNKSSDLVNRELNELDEEDVTPELVQEVMAKHNIADDGGIPLFRFCINPRSFGQSVENLFYVSFLVRDGSVGLTVDSRGLPTLQSAKPYAPHEAQQRGIQKHQAVFSLDFETWRELIDSFNITESIIPHRDDEEYQQGNQPRGWYG